MSNSWSRNILGSLRYNVIRYISSAQGQLRPVSRRRRKSNGCDHFGRIPRAELVRSVRVLGAVMGYVDLGMAQTKVSTLISFPLTNLTGWRWWVWLSAMVIIAGSLVLALYRALPRFAGVFVPIWAAITALHLTVILEVIGMAFGVILGWFLVSGVVASIALFF